MAKNEVKIYDCSPTTVVSSQVEFTLVEEATMQEVIDGVIQGQLEKHNVKPGKYSIHILVTLIEEE